MLLQNHPLSAIVLGDGDARDSCSGIMINLIKVLFRVLVIFIIIVIFAV